MFKLFQKTVRQKVHQRRAKLQRKVLLESLEGRWTPACIASFDAPSGLLTIQGTVDGDAAEVSHDNSGNILLDGAATGATLSTASVIHISTGDSDDAVTIDQTN